MWDAGLENAWTWQTSGRFGLRDDVELGGRSKILVARHWSLGGTNHCWVRVRVVNLNGIDFRWEETHFHYRRGFL